MRLALTAKQTALFLILILFPAFIFAGYNENIAAGLAAYKQNKLVEAYRYYSAAYKEKPSPKLKQILQFISKKYKAGQAAPAAKPAAKQDTPWKWVLLGADAAAAGFTVFAGTEYYKQADKYDKLYEEKNNTTLDNYNLLVKEDKIFRDKEGMYTAGIVIASLAAAYTLADYFFIHAVFPVAVAASFDPAGGEVKLAFNYSY